MLSRLCRPRGFDAYQRAKVKARPIEQHQKAGAPFATSPLEVGLDPRSAEEWNDALVEWRQVSGVGKSEFKLRKASLEFFNPRLKEQLPWATAVAVGKGSYA